MIPLIIFAVGVCAGVILGILALIFLYIDLGYGESQISIVQFFCWMGYLIFYGMIIGGIYNLFAYVFLFFTGGLT